MNGIDRQSKVDYLQKLAAGKLAPADLLQLLPVRDESWFQTEGKDAFMGEGTVLSREQLDIYRNTYPGPIRRTIYIIRRRGGNATANEREDGNTLD